jgi:hypothetical protein
MAMLLVLPARLPGSAATAVIGHSVSLSVTSDGAPPFYFQWMKDGRLIINEVGRTLFIRSVAPGNAGDYSVMVMNEYGNTMSDTATLSVSPTEASLSGGGGGGGGGGAMEPWFAVGLILLRVARRLRPRTD